MYRKTFAPDQPKDGECSKCHSKRLLFSRGVLSCSNCDYVIGKTFNKYGAKKTEYNGHRYDSKFESQIAQDLDTRLKANDIQAVERQVKIPLEAYGKHIFNYIIDFVITHNDGHKEYLEAKGYETDIFKAKWKMLEAKLELEDKTAEMTLLKQRSYRNSQKK